MTKDQEIAALKVQVEMFRKHLRELVELKDHKDEHGKSEYYLAHQPLAWMTARSLLAADKKFGMEYSLNSHNKQVILDAVVEVSIPAGVLDETIPNVVVLQLICKADALISYAEDKYGEGAGNG